MSNETQHTPADVRERVAKIVREAMEDARRSERLNTFPQSSMWDYADRILALLRTPRGEGDEAVGEVCDLCGEMFDPSELGTVIGPLGQDDGVPRWYRCPRCARAYDAGYQQGQRDPRGDETADPTASRSDAQGEDQWEDLIFAPIVEAYNEAHAALRDGAQGEAKFDAGDPVALRLAASKLEASGYDVLALRLRKIADQMKCVIAARRSKAQGEG